MLQSLATRVTPEMLEKYDDIFRRNLLNTLYNNKTLWLSFDTLLRKQRLASS